VGFRGRVLSHYLGLLDHLLGDLARAEEHLAEALEFHECIRSPILVAQTQAALAALDAATARGYGDIEADARTALDRLR